MVDSVTEGRPRLAVRLGRRSLRAGLAAVTALVLAVPFTVAWRQHVDRRNVTRQESTPAALIDAATTARWKALGARLPGRAAPVILTYHDIQKNTPSRYVVGPAQFERQLAALRTAGYHTLTTDEFVTYLLGGPVPPRSVMLTFDDGTHGLWTYGDRILARHGMTAVSFLITGRVGRHRPYYLSWQEIARMSRSGRWDFQNHTHDLHSRTPGPDGRLGSRLANRIHLASTGQLESVEHYERRVRGDFTESLRDFERHGLPRSRLFAYPFSKSANPLHDDSSYSRDLVERLFVAAVTDKTLSPEPPGRRATAQQQFQRLEVFSDTSADDLLAEVAARTPVPPSGDPLSRPELWTGDDWKPVRGLGFLTGKGPYPRGKSYRYAAYTPFGSSDWDRYTLDATLRDLPERGGRGTVFVRVGGDATLGVRISRHTAQLVDGTNGDRVLSEQPLDRASDHRVRIVVDGGRTTATVDGRVRLEASHQHGVRGSGGMALTVSKQGEAASWPSYARVRLTPLPGPAPAPGPFDGPGGWVDGDGKQAQTVIGDGTVQPVGITNWTYAAYTPGRRTDYTLRTRMTGLTEEGLHGSVVVRRGAPDQVTVRLSEGWITVLSGPDDRPRTLLSRRLVAAQERDVQVTVGARATQVKVEGLPAPVVVPASGGAGGIALAAHRKSQWQPWPTFEQCALNGGGTR
ncbi:polysaccharide deacetylase family protein [Streptomyces sp. GQFP]|uniref:polysaccharide deacetylase family protein n=1 Tax=Streptomyces sp. GQFP TaxID=2907545 RepID=UPI001F213AEF|nr:polysaccharide deacetylase family protein [Streptomyces sp. GQFP]UIX29795.1 polysaccharide deacetylase family protein [Streptomyces sp. GQFP]